MTLPNPVQRYFEADRANDPEALARTFAPDGIVEDEKRTFAGHQAIEGWWRETKAKYERVTEPLEPVEQDGVLRVRARLIVRFPSSPAILTFQFRLTGNHITRLEVGF